MYHKNILFSNVIFSDARIRTRVFDETDRDAHTNEQRTCASTDAFSAALNNF